MSSLRHETTAIHQVAMDEVTPELLSLDGLEVEIILQFVSNVETELEKELKCVMTETQQIMTDEVVFEPLKQAGLEVLLIHQSDRNEVMV